MIKMMEKLKAAMDRKLHGNVVFCIDTYTNAAVEPVAHHLLELATDEGTFDIGFRGTGSGHLIIGLRSEDVYRTTQVIGHYLEMSKFNFTYAMKLNDGWKRSRREVDGIDIYIDGKSVEFWYGEGLFPQHVGIA